MGSNIKTDLETKFKWLEYDGDPFTEIEDENVRILFRKNSQIISNGLLSSFGLQECAGRIPMITGLKFRIVNQVRVNELFGTYKQSDLEPNLALTPYSDDQKKYIRMVIKNSVGTLLERYPFESLKKKFRECAASNYFVIDLTIVPLSDQYGIPRHANMLIIAKNRGTVYWIEPQHSPDLDKIYVEEMIASIKKLVEDLGMADPTIINPVEICPQTITKDKNCMFWTYIIFLLILLNPDKDHNLLVKQFLSKYPTKEALTRYIDGFKRAAIEILPPPAPAPGGKRSRKRKLHKKRKTYRRKKSIFY